MDLPDAVDAVYNNSGFAIDSEITSTFVLQQHVFQSTSYFFNITDDDDLEVDLWGFMDFDFAAYQLYDWIVLLGAGLVISICCCCWWFALCVCLAKRRYVAVSKLNQATGRISVFELSPSGAASVSIARNVSTTSTVRPVAMD